MEMVVIGLDDVEETLVEERCTAILFSLDVCAPCILVQDALARLAASFPRLVLFCIVKLTFGVDDEDPRLTELGVRHFPTLVLVEKGAILGVLRGAVTRSGPLNDERLARWLANSLDAPEPGAQHAA
jgi:hypothetical protein